MFPFYQMVPASMLMGLQPLRMVASGAMSVPQALKPEQLPPAVMASLSRLMEAPPKPAVTLAVMNQTQASMIAPDLPFRADV